MDEKPRAWRGESVEGIRLSDDDGKLFDIVDVSASAVTRLRDDGKPRMQFDSESRDRVAVVQITSDL